MIGRTLRQYRVVEKLGEGGMGEVFLAEDSKLGRKVALKILPQDFCREPLAVERFQREARAASALSHPNICVVYDVDEFEGVHFLAMELLEGETLKQRIARGALPVEEFLELGTQLADALATAHEKGILHRDVKPANIFLTRRGQAKLVDFGLAKLTHPGPDAMTLATAPPEALVTSPGSVVGTVAYMSPEQARGEELDARSDVFSFGAVLYEMATGRTPFLGNTSAVIFDAILNRTPARPLELNSKLPPEVERIISKALEKDREVRYQSAAELRADLRRLKRETESGRTGKTAAVVVTHQPWWKHQSAIWGVLAVVLLAIGVWKGMPLLRPGETPDSSATGNANRSAGGARTSTGGKASANREANEYFERGALFLSKQLDLLGAMRMFQKALDLDPKFAEARASFAQTEVGMLDWAYSNDSSWLYKAEEDARRASEDDPDCASAYAVRAQVYFHQGRKELIPTAAEKALQIDPQNGMAKNWLGIYYQFSENNARAKGLYQEMLTLDPLDVWARWNYSDVLRTEGEVQAALREAEKIVDQNPRDDSTRGYLAFVQMDAGELAKARATYNVIRRPTPYIFSDKVIGARLLAAEGKRAEALREMDAGLLKFLEANKWFTLMASEVYAAAGEKEKALDWLERAVNGGDERADWFQRDPFLVNIRKEPRFQQILASVVARKNQRSATK